jgi:hypothetical protein
MEFSARGMRSQASDGQQTRGGWGCRTGPPSDPWRGLRGAPTQEADRDPILTGRRPSGERSARRPLECVVQVPRHSPGMRYPAPAPARVRSPGPTPGGLPFQMRSILEDSIPRVGPLDRAEGGSTSTPIRANPYHRVPLSRVALSGPWDAFSPLLGVILHRDRRVQPLRHLNEFQRNRFSRHCEGGRGRAALPRDGAGPRVNVGGARPACPIRRRRPLGGGARR